MRFSKAEGDRNPTAFCGRLLAPFDSNEQCD
uniref:Uncharacterized protein n=1 Tax=Anguilla anguilla TaxID=7936 RepID=A0A0E9UNN9_ANGAN